MERYGKTKMQKLRAFEALKQKTGETLSAYADRVRKACYGLSKDNEEIIHKFYKSILVSNHVYDDVINLPCKNLQQAVEYVEQHSKSGSNSTYDKSSLRCSNCKRLGHTAKTCRQKKQPPKGKKVDVIEEEDADACVAEDDDGSSVGDVEEPQVDCCSDEEDVDVFNTEGEADVEDLGKRKGTNSARDEIVKKLKETPPNANTS